MKKIAKRLFTTAMAVLMVTSFAACGKDSTVDTPVTDAITQPEVTIPTNPITGSTEYSESSVGKRPIAIVINNQPQARPQWGLNSADAVFEFPVEGMITRMLWIFSDYEKLPEKIGPIRSARHHFVYTAGSLDAIYLHWGGSTLGYQAIKDSGIDDIDAMKHGDGKGAYFYRDKTRNVAIEHRGITDGTSVTNAINELIDRPTLKQKSIGTPFVFSDKKVKASNPCNTLSFVFSSNFKRTFKYDVDNNLYYNSMNGEPFCDGNTDKQNAVTNVLVLYAPVKTLANELVDVDLTGGTGIYVTGGTYAKVNWSKGNDAKSKLELTYEDGSNVKLNKGKTWFNFVPDDCESKTVIA